MATSYSVTDIGRRRQMNQDYVYTSDDPVGELPNLYIVADGMGGHKAGDFASNYAVNHMVEEVKNSTEHGMHDIIDVALHRVNAGLHEIATTRDEYRGCGTTIVLCSVDDGILHVANVGDSRLYVIGSRIWQVSVDHSLVQEMIRAGSLDRKRARTHPEKNVITRAIGAEESLDIDFFTWDLHSGDLILLCTDGLTNMLEDDEIRDIVSGTGSLKEKATKLIERANENGGLDNISALLIDPFARQ